MQKSTLGEVNGEDEHEAKLEYDREKQSSIKPPSNPHSAHCKRCGTGLVPKEEEKPIWWIQVSNNVYCKKCYEKYIKPFQKK